MRFGYNFCSDLIKTWFVMKSGTCLGRFSTSNMNTRPKLPIDKNVKDYYVDICSKYQIIPDSGVKTSDATRSLIVYYCYYPSTHMEYNARNYLAKDLITEIIY